MGPAARSVRPVSAVYEYQPGTDTFRQHHIQAERTACGLRPWSDATDPSNDPDGLAIEEIWYDDHLRDNDEVEVCATCYVGCTHDLGSDCPHYS